MIEDIRCQFCGYVPCGCLEIEEEIIELTEEVTDENSEKR